MLPIRSAEALAHALDSPLATSLKGLLTLRYQPDIADLLVIAPQDTMAAIEREIGFTILTNLIDGSKFGEPDFEPCFEWLLDHGAWWEMAFILSDDGPATVLLIPNSPAIDPELRALCQQHGGVSAP